MMLNQSSSTQLHAVEQVVGHKSEKVRDIIVHTEEDTKLVNPHLKHH